MNQRQKHLNMDVVALNETRLLDDETLSELRQCDNPDYVPDVNLFAIMYEDGPVWAKARADGHFAKGSYSTEELSGLSHNFAKEMTIEIQKEYDVCLVDRKLGHMYGMSHDFARIALGMSIPVPANSRKGIRAPRVNIMHSKRIREYGRLPVVVSGKREASNG